MTLIDPFMERATNNHHSYEMIACPCVRSL